MTSTGSITTSRDNVLLVDNTGRMKREEGSVCIARSMAAGESIEEVLGSDCVGNDGVDTGMIKREEQVGEGMGVKGSTEVGGRMDVRKSKHRGGDMDGRGNAEQFKFVDSSIPYDLTPLISSSFSSSFLNSFDIIEEDAEVQYFLSNSSFSTPSSSSAPSANDGSLQAGVLGYSLHTGSLQTGSLQAGSLTASSLQARIAAAGRSAFRVLGDHFFDHRLDNSVDHVTRAVTWKRQRQKSLNDDDDDEDDDGRQKVNGVQRPRLDFRKMQVLVTIFSFSMYFIL